ncbi:MAG: ThuA domain-containing protein [Tunicatimonas sp.]|uniref:ThuA domain-containing protein n=1 Tax=Tunicatimonas sp. TaxID=1940096 RepID=UPI003C7553B4
MLLTLTQVLQCLSFILLPGIYDSTDTQPTTVAIHVDAGPYTRVNTPISVVIENGEISISEREFQLVEISEGIEKPIAAQWGGGYQPTLHWILNGETPAGTTRHFTLKTASNELLANSNEVTVKDNGQALAVQVNNKEVLAYHYGLTPVPEGVSERYRRGGYIHPLRAPNGGVLTRIQPSDHYHHYGVWNPWTTTEFEGEELDFWNLYKGQGTVRVKDVSSVVEGNVFGQISATHKHVVLDTLNAENDKVALNETWNVRVWNAQNDGFLVDFTSTLNPATNQPFTIKEYRYQGFGFRANELWDDNSATLVTSEGLSKSDGNGTRARWSYVEGPTDAGQAGVLFMTYPTNFNYPEMVRIWPTGANEGKENVFFNFNPAMDRDWKLLPGHEYTLKYRMLTYDGEMDAATAERHWQDFAYPPQVKVSSQPSLEGKKMLLYTKNGEGFVHKNIPSSIKAIKKIADENDFEVVASEDPVQFTNENLKQYDVLIFSNTNNDIFDTPEQEQAFKEYMQSGGRFVGIHSACGSERDWDWFAQMLGGRFHRHPPRQDFEVLVLDNSHPSTLFLPKIWSINDDECYYMKHLNPDNHVLLAADLRTVEDEKRDEYPANYFGDQFPLAWCHEFDGGRQWYTALGHRAEHYDDPMYMQHILGGIIWVLSDEAP